MLSVRRFPIVGKVNERCTDLYARSHAVRGASRAKEGVEHNEEITEHTVNELLVFVTEHLPHLIGSAHG